MPFVHDVLALVTLELGERTFSLTGVGNTKEVLIMRWIVLTLLLLVAVLGLSDLVFAEDNGVIGWWALSESELGPVVFRIRFSTSGSFYSEYYDQDFIEEKNAGKDRLSIPHVLTLKTIIERGTYTVSGDSVILHIAESDIADRIGVTFTVTFSRADIITFTNARDLTFGYVDEDQVTLYDPSYHWLEEPFMGWWEIPPKLIAEFSSPFAIELGRSGSFHSCVPHELERGTYAASDDSITFTISESILPDRVGIRFTVTFWLFPDWGGITFTNAPILTAGYIKEETIILGRITTAVRSSSWGKIKSSYR